MVSRVARQLGVGSESLRNWGKQTDIDAGQRPGLTTEEREELKRLCKENKELRRANRHLPGGGGAGEVLAGTGAVNAGRVGALSMVDIGTIAGPTSPAITSFEYSAGVVFTSSPTGYVFAASDETGEVVAGFTDDSGPIWATTAGTFPSS